MSVDTEAVLLTSGQVCEQVGTTARQLDFWVSRGYLDPQRQNGGHGSGYDRLWPPIEVRAAGIMVLLVSAGMMPIAAAEHARQFIWLQNRGLPARLEIGAPGGPTVVLLLEGEQP